LAVKVVVEKKTGNSVLVDQLRLVTGLDVLFSSS
jgi:hypothetical protein